MPAGIQVNMASKALLSILAIAATGIFSVSAAALPELKAFTIPADVEILDLRTEEDKRNSTLVSTSLKPAAIQGVADDFGCV